MGDKQAANGDWDSDAAGLGFIVDRNGGRSADRHRRAGVAEAGEVRDFDRDLLADARVDLPVPAGMAARKIDQWLDYGTGAGAGDWDYRRTGGARHQQPFQYRHSVGSSSFYNHGRGDFDCMGSLHRGNRGAIPGAVPRPGDGLGATSGNAAHRVGLGNRRPDGEADERTTGGGQTRSKLPSWKAAAAPQLPHCVLSGMSAWPGALHRCSS